jgi:hypothetical protein
MAACNDHRYWLGVRDEAIYRRRGPIASRSAVRTFHFTSAGQHQMKERTPQRCPAVLLTPAHLASIMIDEPVAQLDSTRIKPLIDALKIKSGHGGGGFMVRGPPPPPQLFS